MSHELLSEQLHAILGPGGIAEQTSAGFRFNERQLKFAEHALAGFLQQDPHKQRTSLNALQAATGTGKTLGYIVPLMVYAAHTRDRVAVSTYTRYLQQQILNKDATAAAGWVKQVTGIELKIARRIGMTSYASAYCCVRLIAKLDQNEQEAREVLDSIVKWLSKTDKNGTPIHSGVIDDFLAENGLENLPGNLTVSSIALRERDMGDAGYLCYLQEVDKSKEADVLICNHALVVLNAMRWASILDGDRKISVLVCDEADRLNDAAVSITSLDMPIHRLDQTLQLLDDRIGLNGVAEASSALCNYLKNIKPNNTNLMSIAGNAEVPFLVNELTKAIQPHALKIAVQSKSGRLFEDAVSDDDVVDLLDTFNDLVAIRDALVDQSAGTPLISWSPVRAFPSIKLGSPRAARILSRLWSERDWDGEDVAAPPRSYLKAVLFTSATLGAPGRRIPQAFNEFFNLVGVMMRPRKGETDPIHDVRLELLASFEPTNFGQLRFVLADPRCTNPTLDNGQEKFSNPEWLDYTASMVRAAHAAGGKSLVLTTSYFDTEELARRLTELPVIVQQRGVPLSHFVGQYKASQRGILITPSGWEGVDLPGEIQQLVITRIPFTPPNTLEFEVERLDLMRKGMDLKGADKIIIGKMILGVKRKLAQGLGRPIRSSSDDCTVWVADPRFPLPDAIVDSLDPLFMEAPSRMRNEGLKDCIPRRFATSFDAAKFFVVGQTELYLPG